MSGRCENLKRWEFKSSGIIEHEECVSLHNLGLRRLYCVPRADTSREKMIKFAASSGVGAIIVEVILVTMIL